VFIFKIKTDRPLISLKFNLKPKLSKRECVIFNTSSTFCFPFFLDGIIPPEWMIYFLDLFIDEHFSTFGCSIYSVALLCKKKKREMNCD